MILLVDVGNSAIKWAILEENNLSTQQHISYELDKLTQILTEIWQLLEPPDNIFISNVAGPQVANIIIDWSTKHWQCQPDFAKTVNYQCGVKNGYRYPQQLGIDRWLALIGAYQLDSGDLCIIDCGTAVTIDILASDGQHLGGVIAPGLKLMRAALSQNTYKLTNFSQPTVELNLATQTNDGIILGTSYAVVGLLEYIINKLNEHPKLILTGGDAIALEPFLSGTYRYIPNLVLQGLKTIYHEKSSSITNSGKY